MKTEEGRVSHLGAVSFGAGGEGRAGMMSSSEWDSLRAGEAQEERRKGCQAEPLMAPDSWFANADALNLTWMSGTGLGDGNEEGKLYPIHVAFTTKSVSSKFLGAAIL